jgi:hypothetical protein
MPGVPVPVLVLGKRKADQYQYQGIINNILRPNGIELDRWAGTINN